MSRVTGTPPVKGHVQLVVGLRGPALAAAAVLVILGLAAPVPVAAQAAVQATQQGAAQPVVERQHGTAAGHDHAVPASATESTADLAPNPPRRAPGALPPDQRHPSQPLPSPTTRSLAVGEPEVVPAEPVAGFDERTSVEDTGRRGRTIKTFRNADGTETTHFYDHAVHWRRPDGSWADIDTRLTRLADGRWRNTADARPVVFAATTDGADGSDLGTIVLDAGHAVGFEIAGGRPVAGVVSGSEITYPDAQPAADIQLEASAGGIKETLVLDSPQAPDTWVFPLRLQGLTPSINAVGNVILADETGAERAWIPAG